jgi:hypothetical protein
MIPAGKNVAIYFEKVEGFAADAKELAIFVKHNSVAKSISHDDFHYR